LPSWAAEILLFGEHSLEELEWKTADGRTQEKPIRTLFVMIGATPNTEWLHSCIDLDDRGFIVTGQSSKVFPFQTSVPGIFAIGDVRSGSVKRVASAVGEGSIVVSWVHQYLSSQRLSKKSLSGPSQGFSVTASSSEDPHILI
jgi:thioredoxin reductase (NADPH)